MTMELVAKSESGVQFAIRSRFISTRLTQISSHPLHQPTRFFGLAKLGFAALVSPTHHRRVQAQQLRHISVARPKLSAHYYHRFFHCHKRSILLAAAQLLGRKAREPLCRLHQCLRVQCRATLSLRPRTSGYLAYSILRLRYPILRAQYSSLIRAVELFVVPKFHPHAHEQAEPLTSQSLRRTEMPKNRLRIDQLRFIHTQIRPMTAVAKVLRASRHLSSHRVQMNVPD